MKRYFAFLSVLCVSVVILLLADATGDLRPTADGGVEQWQNNANTSCASATCYTEVNEASGANCTTTPGDGTFNHSTATTNQTQRYDIDESTIPDGSTVTSAVIRVCAQRGGTQNVNFVMRFCVNGTCTDTASNTAASAWADFSGTSDFADDVKDGTDDYEIGVQNTQARDLRVTALEVDVTYTPVAGGGPRRMFISRNLRPIP